MDEDEPNIEAIKEDAYESGWVNGVAEGYDRGVEVGYQRALEDHGLIDPNTRKDTRYD